MLTGFPESSLGTLISSVPCEGLEVSAEGGADHLSSAWVAPYSVLPLLSSVAALSGAGTEVSSSFLSVIFIVVWLNLLPSISGINRYYEPRKE